MFDIILITILVCLIALGGGNPPKQFRMWVAGMGVVLILITLARMFL